MKFKFMILIMTLFIAIGCSSNRNERKQIEKDKTFMWEVTGKNNSLYILGSIHLMPEEVYPLKEVITNAFSQSDILVVEADPRNVNQDDVQKIIIESSMYTDGKTLKSEISDELYTYISGEFKKVGLSIEQFNMYKPWYITLTLSVLEIQKAGMSPELGIDMYFLNLAKEKDIKIEELESAYGQIELLSTIPEEVQKEYLEYSVENYENTEDILRIMVDSWKTGDVEAMYDATKGKLREQAERSENVKTFYNLLFANRDKEMVEKLENMLKSNDGKKRFVVVGAGHLIGEDGIINRLRTRGYKVTQK